MSTVANVVLSFSEMEDEEVVIRFVNELLTTTCRRRGWGVNQFLVEQPAGGSKALERPTYIGAFNHFNAEAFLSGLTKYSWAEPGNVQLFVCDDLENRYRERFQALVFEGDPYWAKVHDALDELKSTIIGLALDKTGLLDVVKALRACQGRCVIAAAGVMSQGEGSD